MQMPMQIHSLDLDALDRATLPDIEYVRGQMGISYADLCRAAEVDVGSYRRWRLWMHGRGGGEPSRSSMVAVRAGLRRLIEQRQRAAMPRAVAAE